MLYLIESFIVLAGVFCLVLGLLLMIPAAIISLFKIEEADRYFGVGKLGGERLILKGLPFSLGRMTEYGIVMLFSNTSYMKKRYARELDQIAANAPPKRLVRLLTWLYSSWILLGIAFFIFGGLLMII